MTGICLGVAFSVSLATLPATAITLSWSHSVEHIRWEEDYSLRDGKLVITAARVRGNGAGMEPGADAVRHGDVWEYHPDIGALSKITLANSEFTPDYTLCVEGRCRLLNTLLGAAYRHQPIEIFPCPAQ